MIRFKNQINHQKIYFFTVFLLIFVVSCKVGPKFSRENQDIVKRFLAKENFNNISQNIIITDNSQNWWQKIDDATFQKYLTELLQNNYSIKEAIERAVQAEQNYKIERGGFFPKIDIVPSVTRTITPSNSLAFGFGGPSKFYNTNYSIKANVSWQADFFGKIRNLNEKAKNELVASRFDIEALKQSLIADLLKSRIAIAINNELFFLANQNENDKENIYFLVKNRYEVGANDVSLLSLNDAKNNFENSKNEVLAAKRQLFAEIYNFQSLLGKFPNEKQINLDEFFIPKLPEKIESSVPAKLLDRRPDLKALELRLRASNADIGVAIADLYPDFTISASTGFSGNDYKNLFNSRQLASSLSGNIAAKIFQGGALKANVGLKKAKFKELSANYAKQIIVAAKEVETFLKNEEELSREVLNKENSNQTMINSLNIAKNRYEGGVEKLQNYLVVKEKSYLAKKAFILAIQENWNNRINLYLALGGDILSK